MEQCGENRARVGMRREYEIRTAFAYVPSQLLSTEHPHKGYHGPYAPAGAVEGTEQMLLYERDAQHYPPRCLIERFHPVKVEVVEEIDKAAVNADAYHLLMDSLCWNIVALAGLYVYA